MKQYIPVNNKYISCKVYFDEIVFFEKKTHYINISTMGEPIYLNGSMCDMKKYVEGRSAFYTCHSYLIINLDLVERMEDGDIFFSNGDVRHLGKNNFMKAKAVYARYITQRAQLHL